LIEAFKAHFKEFETFKGDLDNEIALLRKDVKGILNTEGPGDIKAAELYQEIHVMKSRIHDMNSRLGRRNSLTALLQSATQEKHLQLQQPMKKALTFVEDDDEVDAVLNPKKRNNIESSSASTTTSSVLESSSSVSHSHHHIIEVDLSASCSDASGDSSSKNLVSGNTTKVTSVSATTNDEKVSIQLNVTNKDKHWKVLTVLLATLVVLAVAIALILGLRNPEPAPLPFTGWSDNIISNPSFNTPDPALPRRAQYWDGNYQLLQIPPPASKRNTLSTPDAPPDASVTASDYDNKDDEFWASQPRLTNPPLRSNTLMHLFVNSSDPNLTPSLAKQKNKPKESLPVGAIVALNITAAVYGEFIFAENLGGLFELDVSVYYRGQAVPDVIPLVFNAETNYQNGKFVRLK